MNKLIGEYVNGNYTVRIFEDGTKIKFTEEDEFISEFPESIDLKITNRCNMNCPMCHENSTADGDHGSLIDEETVKFITSIHPYTELAIGGGNPISHPQLMELLRQLKAQNVIANITINQAHFMKHREYINALLNSGMIKGLGISLTDPTDSFIEYVQAIPNAVIHVINGVVGPELKKLYGKNLKILILGYKEFRRGWQYFTKNQEDILAKKTLTSENLQEIINNFEVVSFDNLALEQLDVKSLMTEQEWSEFYLGDDGSHTMYVDLVKKEFAKSSTSIERHALLDNVDDMFKIIKI